MARKRLLLLALVLFTIPAFAKANAAEGKLSIFRWKKGFRAERAPVFVGEMEESAFRTMVKEGKLPASPEIFAGCYLAHFEPPQNTDRAPASAAGEVKPKSEIFRICH